MTRKLISVAVLGWLVSACQTTNADVGKGPITLSPWVMAAFEWYLARENPSYFAVSADGQVSGASVCNSYECADSVGDVALSSCRKRSANQRCHLFASGRTVVWNGPVGYTTNEFLHGDHDRRAFWLFWDDRTVGMGARSYARGVARRVDRHTFRLDFLQSKKLGSCAGTVDLRSNRFEVDCSKRGAASGRFASIERSGIGGAGTGEDQTGRILTLDIAPRTAYRDEFMSVQTN